MPKTFDLTQQFNTLIPVKFIQKFRALGIFPVINTQSDAKGPTVKILTASYHHMDSVTVGYFPSGVV